MKIFLVKMLVKETREQRKFIRGKTVLVNIITSEICEPHVFIKHEKYFTYFPKLSKSPLDQVVI